MHSIYLITNQTNGRYYVGQTGRSLNTRLRGHLYDAHSVKRPLRMPLHRAMAEQPASDFTIAPVAECATKEEANEREKLFIIVLRATDPEIGYNVHPGGNGGCGFAPRFSSDSRRRMSQSAKERCARNPTTHCAHGHEFTPENTILRKGKNGGTKKRCRICTEAREKNRAAQRKAERHRTGPGTGSRQRVKTHCPKGHAYTPANTWMQPQSNGRGGFARRCKACRNEEIKNWKRRKKTAPLNDKLSGARGDLSV